MFVSIAISLSAISVITTIFVLHLHHKPSSSDVPRLLKTILFRQLIGRLLCVSLPEPEPETKKKTRSNAIAVKDNLDDENDEGYAEIDFHGGASSDIRNGISLLSDAATGSTIPRDAGSTGTTLQSDAATGNSLPLDVATVSSLPYDTTTGSTMPRNAATGSSSPLDDADLYDRLEARIKDVAALHARSKFKAEALTSLSREMDDVIAAMMVTSSRRDEEESESDWQTLAKIVDRGVFWIVFTVLVISIVWMCCFI